MTLDLQDNSLNAILNNEQQKLDADWTTENAKQRRDKFKSKTQNLLLADAPGQITDELRILLQPADRIILIINNTKTEEIDKWESVADDLDIDVMFTLISLPSLSAGAVGWEDEDISTQRGKICSISRSDVDSQVMPCYDPTTKRMIRQIAKKILAVVSG
jgi:hypothetical protein